MTHIKLYGKYADGRYALVDEADFALVNEYRWWFDKNTGYPMTMGWDAVRKRVRRFKLHRLLMPLKKGLETDHINRNKLDNRRCNLRYCTKGENMRNSMRRDCKTGVRGVFFIPGKNPWQAKIRMQGKYFHLGSFSTKEKAAEAYQNALANPANLPAPKLPRWKESELHLLKRYKEIGAASIATLTGRHISAVRAKASRMSLT